MIMILGHNPLGNVIHMIVGPETELFEDIHGAKIMDITEPLKAVTSGEHVFVSLTRCKSEPVTEAMLKAGNIPYMSSFSGLAEAGLNPGGAKATTQDKTTAKATKVGTKDKCQYCKREADLLPVPGFKICAVCAQIELGQLRTKKAKETPNAGA